MDAPARKSQLVWSGDSEVGYFSTTQNFHCAGVSYTVQAAKIRNGAFALRVQEQILIPQLQWWRSNPGRWNLLSRPHLIDVRTVLYGFESWSFILSKTSTKAESMFSTPSGGPMISVTSYFIAISIPSSETQALNFCE